MAIATELTAEGTTKTIVSGKAPIRNQNTWSWGSEFPLGTLASSPSYTLPPITYGIDGFAGDITITATQGSGNSYDITLVVADTSTETIVFDTTSGTSITIPVEAGKNIEINAKPVSATQISVLVNSTEV